MTFINANCQRQSFATLTPVAALKEMRKRFAPMAGFSAWTRTFSPFSAVYEAGESGRVGDSPAKGSRSHLFGYSWQALRLKKSL
jgi:hypothetical protein